MKLTITVDLADPAHAHAVGPLDVLEIIEREAIEHPLAPCSCFTEGEWEEADRLYFEKHGVPYTGPRP